MLEKNVIYTRILKQSVVPIQASNVATYIKLFKVKTFWLYMPIIRRR
jgi:hypothetical protein